MTLAIWSNWEKAKYGKGILERAVAYAVMVTIMEHNPESKNIFVMLVHHAFF